MQHPASFSNRVRSEPSPGTYPIVSPSSAAVDDVPGESEAWLPVEVELDEGGSELFASEVGTLEIEEASKSEMRGRRGFETSPHGSGNLGPVSGTGSFRSNEGARVDAA